NFLSDRSLTGLVVDQLQVADKLPCVVGCALHCNHPRGLFGCTVLNHSLIGLGLDETNQQGIQQLLGIRFVEVVPLTFLDLFGVRVCSQRQQLVDRRLLGHGVDELVGYQIQAIHPAFLEGIEHDLDAADQIIDRRRFTDVADGCNHVAAKTTEEACTLVTDHAEVCLDLLIVPFLHVLDQCLEQVRVQATAQATIGRYNRSEEHTSELQSRENLVCRLLLEKKKKKTNN